LISSAYGGVAVIVGVGVIVAAVGVTVIVGVGVLVRVAAGAVGVNTGGVEVIVGVTVVVAVGVGVAVTAPVDVGVGVGIDPISNDGPYAKLQPLKRQATFPEKVPVTSTWISMRSPSANAMLSKVSVHVVALFATIHEGTVVLWVTLYRVNVNFCPVPGAVFV